MFEIQNNKAILCVDEKGAEICSFKLKSDGLERMWQGNPEYWSGRNPILFPMVTNTYNGIQHINGKDYFMKNHGILRSAMFTCIFHDEKSIAMSYTSDEESKKLYPFDFTMDVKYTLIDAKVKISYTLHNFSDETMPFGFGLHPAFNCPLEKDEKFTDYVLEFSEKETLKGILGPYGLNDEKIVPCDYGWLKDNPTMLYEGPKSTYVTLHNDKHALRVMISGYEFIAFWTKENAPYICIEPWHSHGDFEKVDREFADRPCTTKLEAKGIWETDYSIEIIK